MEQTFKFNTIAKDSLFYGRWQYCMTFTLQEVSALKTLEHSYIDSIIERRVSWREISIQRWRGGHTHSRHIWDEITPEVVANLHELADMLLATTVPYKLVTSVNRAWVYSNDLGLFKLLSANQNLLDQNFTEAIITRPKNSIKLRNPKHTHRSFMRSIKLLDHEKTRLVNFFNNQPSIRLSPAFEAWLMTPFNRSQDYFFIDHSGESWLVMLSLVKPGLIRKTLDIVSA